MTAPHLPAPFTLTLFPCLTDANGSERRDDVSLDDLFESLEKPKLFPVGDLASKPGDPSKYQKPATLAGFGTFAARENKRGKDAFEFSTCVPLDFDDATTIAETIEKLRRYEFVGHTTFNHRVNGGPERFRIFPSLSRPILSEAEYRVVWDYLNGLAGERADAAARSVVNFWFLPGCPDNRAEDYRRFQNSGEPVDVDAVIAAAAMTPSAPDARPASLKPDRFAHTPSSPARSGSGHVRVDIEASTIQARALRSLALGKLAAAWVPNAAARAATADSRTRHQAKLALAGGLAREGFSESAALDLMAELAQLVGDPNHDAREAIVHSTYARKGHDVATGWPTLEAMIGQDAVSAAKTLFRRAEHVLNEAAFPNGFGAHAERPLVALGVGDACDGLLFGPELAEALPPLEYLVTEIGMVAGAGAPHLVAGYGYTGKTMALQSLLLSLATGRAVWGAYAPVNLARVVHVDLEQGRRLTSRRYQRLAIAMGVDLAELGDVLAVAAMPRLSLTEEHRPGWRALMSGRQVLLLDSLRAATGGQDESSSEIRSGLDMLGSLSEETGCRTICIHHARKPQKDDPGGGRFVIRGSSAIFDACDSVYIFSAGKGEPVNVEHEKARSHGDLVEDVALTIADVPGVGGGDPKGGLEIKVLGADVARGLKEERAKKARDAVARKDADTLRALVAARPGLGANELREAAGKMNAPRFAAAKLVLREQIETRPEKVGRAVKEAHYLRAPPSGG